MHNHFSINNKFYHWQENSIAHFAVITQKIRLLFSRCYSLDYAEQGTQKERALTENEMIIANFWQVDKSSGFPPALYF